MIDLLGDPVAAAPPMTESLPMRVFRMNDCEWWMARTLDEAKQDAAHQWGYPSVLPAEKDEMFDEAHELSDEELARLKFVEDAEVPRDQWVRRTFREELDRRIAAGETKPGLFACTEY